MTMIAIWQTERRTATGGCSRSWIPIAVACAILFVHALPSDAYWLPWTTERDKIDRRLNEIWEAIVAKDRHKLKFMVVGLGAKNFIDREISVIEQLGIESVECRVTNVRISNYDWAFVVFEKVDTLKSGGELKNEYMKAMRRVDGDWRLLTNVRKRDRPGKRHERLSGNGVTAEVKKRDDATAGRLPPLQQVFQPEEGEEEE